MSHQRAIKKELMKQTKLETKKVTHFFRGKKLYATRIESMIGLYKFQLMPGRGINKI